MIFLLVILLIAVFLLAPLRKRLLCNGAWQLTIPILIGLIVSVLLIHVKLPAGAPPWVPFFALVMGTAMIAGALHDGFKDIFRDRK